MVPHVRASSDIAAVRCRIIVQVPVLTGRLRFSASYNACCDGSTCFQLAPTHSSVQCVCLPSTYKAQSPSDSFALSVKPLGAVRTWNEYERQNYRAYVQTLDPASQQRERAWEQEQEAAWWQQHLVQAQTQTQTRTWIQEQPAPPATSGAAYREREALEQARELLRDEERAVRSELDSVRRANARVELDRRRRVKAREKARKKAREERERRADLTECKPCAFASTQTP